MSSLITGPLTKNLLSLVDLVAASSHFQQRCNVTTAKQAEGRIYYPWHDRADSQGVQLEQLRPCAIISQGDFAYSLVGGGAQHYLYPSGALVLLLTDNERERDRADYRASYVDFLAFVDGVLADVAELAATDDRIALTAIRQSQAPAQNPPQEDGAVIPYWHATYDMEFGAVGAG